MSTVRSNRDFPSPVRRHAAAMSPVPLPVLASSMAISAPTVILPCASNLWFLSSARLSVAVSVTSYGALTHGAVYSSGVMNPLHTALPPSLTVTRYCVGFVVYSAANSSSVRLSADHSSDEPSMLPLRSLFRTAEPPTARSAAAPVWPSFSTDIATCGPLPP